MRNRVTSVFSILMFACLLGFFSTLGQNKKVIVKVDERIELLYTIERLGGNPREPCANTDYKREIEIHFQAFKNHPAVSFITAMLNSEGISSSALVWYAYQCSFPDFKLEGKIVEDECQIENYQHYIDTLTQFRKLLSDFYVQSHFHDFFLKHKKLYDTICAPTAKYIDQIAIVDTIEKHYGQAKKAYYLVLSPLVHPGGFGVQVHRKSGDYVFGIVGPAFDSKTTPIFPPHTVFKDLVLHEFSHSFCNWIIHKHFRRLNVDSCLADTLTKVNEHIRLYYGGDWETSLFEHLTRANEIVLCKKVLGAEEAKVRYKEYHDEGGWIFLEGLVPLIEGEYLNNRSSYKTEEQLVPKIAEYLDGEREKFCR